MIPILVPLLAAASTVAYIPASATNSTQDAIAGGLNVTDISKLRLQWFSNGNYVEHVSYQLAGNGSQGISKGVLIHFSEDSVNELTPPTSAPWIAMVPCDANATSGASMEVDIFTLARDKGAVAALLYSLYSLACVINPEYADPATFDQVFDIFSTQSKTSAHLIDYQFGQLSPTNTSLSKYDSRRLNDSADAINQSINQGYPSVPGFLYAVLETYNATEVSNNPPTTGANSGNGNGNGSGSRSSSTALAMIVLYAITGCVSALFCVVIVSGAIRALRHPERYGPRARLGSGGPPQSRARGLTRAILDTFPIVKFGGGGGNEEANSAAHNTGSASTKDPEAQELGQWGIVDQRAAATQSMPLARNGEATTITAATPALAKQSESQESINTKAKDEPSDPPGSRSSAPYLPNQDSARRLDLGEGPSSSSSPPLSAPTPNQRPSIPIRDNLSPDSMGRETCPICIVDFEEGDDLRVLPCEGKHAFHQQCVDPWLLELSSSCPICRHDFLALESILSNEDHAEGQQINADELHLDRDHRNQRTHSSRRPGLTTSMYGSNRFSRYIRFASGRRHGQQQGQLGQQQEQESVQHQDGSSSHEASPSESPMPMYHGV